MREGSNAILTGRDVLVTGGAGFIGSHLVDRLVAEGYFVVVLDDLSTGRLDNINEHIADNRIRFVKGDIRNYHTVIEAVEGVNMVIHLAGMADVAWSVQNPGATHEINVTGTLNVLRACVDAKVSKLVFASSCAVYGNPVALPIGENHPLNPVSPYAASKLAAEAYVQAFSSDSALGTTCLRLFNVYGARQQVGKSSGVIARFAAQLAEGVSPTIYGDGEQQRDFVYVENVVDAFLGALRAVGEPEIYNIGSGKAFSINQVFTSLRRLIGKERIQPTYLPRRLGDVRTSVADIRKASTQLDFKPAVTLDEGLRLVLEGRVVLAGK
jgi:UDP-glucose 4-epimerase